MILCTLSDQAGWDAHPAHLYMVSPPAMTVARGVFVDGMMAELVTHELVDERLRDCAPRFLVCIVCRVSVRRSSAFDCECVGSVRRSCSTPSGSKCLMSTCDTGD